VAHLHGTQYNAVTFTEFDFLLFSPNSLYALQEIPNTMRLQSIAVRTLQIFMKSTSFHFYITSFQYTSIALSEIHSMELYRKGHGFYELNSAFSALTWKGDIRNCVDQILSHFTNCETDMIWNIKFAGSLQRNTVPPYFIMRIAKLTAQNFKRSFCRLKILLGVLYEVKKNALYEDHVCPSVLTHHQLLNC